MSYGRFNGGQHFTKKALKAGTGMISPAQIKRFKQLGHDIELNSMTYDKAAHLLKNLKRSEPTSKHSNERDDRTQD
jgi:hypothetical protein